MDTLPLTLEMNTIRPATRSRGSTAWVTASWPITLMSNCFRHSSGLTVSIGPLTTMPALFTIASRRSGNDSDNAAMCPASVTSRMTEEIRCGSALVIAAASCSLRTPAMTSQPRPPDARRSTCRYPARRR